MRSFAFLPCLALALASASAFFACVGDDPETSATNADAGGGGGIEGGGDTSVPGDSGAGDVAVDSGPPGALSWAIGFGEEGTDQVGGIAVDSKGNVIVVGSFKSNSMDVGCAAPLARDTAGANTRSDGYVVKLSPEGKCVWAKAITGAGGDALYSVAVDPQTDAIWIVGETSSSPVVIAGTTVSGDAGTDAFDAVLAKLDAAGNVLVAKTYGGGDYDVLSGIAVAADGSVVTIGSFVKKTNQPISFGPVVAAAADDAADRSYAVVASFTSAGNPVWARTIRGEQTAGSYGGYSSSIAIDKLGDILVTGTSDGPIQPAIYPSYEAPVSSATGGSTDFFVGKITGGGAHTLSWVKVFGGTVDDSAGGVAVDGANNVFLSATFQEAIAFGGAPVAAAGGAEAALAKFQPGGAHVSSRSFSTAQGDVAGGVAAASDGAHYVVGSQMASFDFGNGPTTNNGLQDGFVAAFDPAGKVQWTKTFGGAGVDNVTQVAVQGDHVFIAGRFESNLDVEGNLLTFKGAADVFVAKIRR